MAARWSDSIPPTGFPCALIDVRHPDRRRRRRGACAPDRASGLETWQCDGHIRRTRQGARLRVGEDAGAAAAQRRRGDSHGCPRDHGRSDRWHRRLYVSRTGGGACRSISAPTCSRSVCVLYEMATGQRPFKGESGISILSAIIKDEPMPMTRLGTAVPRDLERLVDQCLAKDPARRPRRPRNFAPGWRRSAWRRRRGPASGAGLVLASRAGGRRGYWPPSLWPLARRLCHRRHSSGSRTTRGSKRGPASRPMAARSCTRAGPAGHRAFTSRHQRRRERSVDTEATDTCRPSRQMAQRLRSVRCETTAPASSS